VVHRARRCRWSGARPLRCLRTFPPRPFRAALYQFKSPYEQARNLWRFLLLHGGPNGIPCKDYEGLRCYLREIGLRNASHFGVDIVAHVALARTRSLLHESGNGSAFVLAPL